VSRGLGILVATMARWSEAVEHFEVALWMNAELGARPWFAHAQDDYARALLRREEPGDRQQVAELSDVGGGLRSRTRYALAGGQGLLTQLSRLPLP
jgi:hypothetical protein